MPLNHSKWPPPVLVHRVVAHHGLHVAVPGRGSQAHVHPARRHLNMAAHHSNQGATLLVSRAGSVSTAAGDDRHLGQDQRQGVEVVRVRQLVCLSLSGIVEGSSDCVFVP